MILSIAEKPLTIMNIKECDDLMKNLVSYTLKDIVIIFLISSEIACNKNQKDYSQHRDIAK